MNAVLTEIERLQSIIAYHQCLTLTEIMANSYQEMRERPVRKPIIVREVIDLSLPIVGQTLVDLLCNVLMEQRVFASTQSASMSHRLLPLYEANALSSNRTWRTHTIPDSEWHGPFIIVWRNDAPERVPDSVQIIELEPPEAPYRAVNLHEFFWYRRWLGPAARWWQLRVPFITLLGEAGG